MAWAEGTGLHIGRANQRKRCHRTTIRLLPKAGALHAHAGVGIQRDGEALHSVRVCGQPSGEPVHIGVRTGHRQGGSCNVQKIVLGINHQQVVRRHGVGSIEE